jgi:hypothetical protein
LADLLAIAGVLLREGVHDSHQSEAACGLTLPAGAGANGKFLHGHLGDPAKASFSVGSMAGRIARIP